MGRDGIMKAGNERRSQSDATDESRRIGPGAPYRWNRDMPEQEVPATPGPGARDFELGEQVLRVGELVRIRKFLEFGPGERGNLKGERVRQAREGVLRAGERRKQVGEPVRKAGEAVRGLREQVRGVGELVRQVGELVRGVGEGDSGPGNFKFRI